MTVPDHSWQGHTVEYTVGVQNHYQYGGNMTAENAYYGTAPFHNKLPSEHFENKNRPFDHGFYHLEESWLAEDTSSPDCPSQTSPLENFVPPAWDLGDKDIQFLMTIITIVIYELLKRPHSDSKLRLLIQLLTLIMKGRSLQLSRILTAHNTGTNITIRSEQVSNGKKLN